MNKIMCHVNYSHLTLNMHVINSSTDSPVKHKSPFQDFAGYWFLLNAAMDIYF